jgi:MFS superfamily sulfate permease-like transporter
MEMASSDGNDNDSNNSTKDQNKTSVVELLDELISHMNTTRSVFKVMILSSFILAPLSLMLAAVFVIHPFFMNRILFRIPEVGVFLLIFIGVSIMLASMWLYIGLSEQRFFSNWDKKFSRYTSLKNQLDKELGENTETD